MTNLIALTSRELKSLWYSPIAYAVGCFFLLLQGLIFWFLVNVLNDPRINPHWNMADLYFGGFFYWIAVFVTVPMLTMRTFSEEKRTGSFETLMTAPVTDTQVVLSKFLGSWIAYAILWASTFLFFLMLRSLAPFDWGPIFSAYLGTLLMGTVLISLGVLASSLTRNQVISGVIAFVAMLILFLLGVFDIFIQDTDTKEFIAYLSLMEQIQDFSKGFFDTRPLVFYASFTGICLLLTGRIIGSARWRS